VLARVLHCMVKMNSVWVCSLLSSVLLCTSLFHSSVYADGGGVEDVSPTMLLANVQSQFSYGVVKELSGLLFLSDENLGRVLLLEESRARERYRLELSVDGELLLSAQIGRRQAISVADSRRYALAMMSRLRQRDKSEDSVAEELPDHQPNQDLLVEELVERTDQNENK